MSGELEDAIRAAETEAERVQQERAAPLPAAEDAEPETPAWSERDEAFARDFGWVPKEEWRGQADQWAPADAFANKLRGRLSTVEKLERRLDQREREIRESQERQQQEIAGVKQMLEAGYKRQIDELKARRRLATLDADADAAERIDAQIEELRGQTSAAAPAAQKPNGKDHPAPAPEAREFMARNSAWFNQPGATNRAATMFAVARADELSQAGYDAAAQLAAVEREVGEKFGLGAQAPQRQTPEPRKPAAPAHQAVDSGSNAHAKSLIASKRKKTWTDIPELVRHEALKSGLYADTPEDRQFIADAYFEQS